jgi:ABC-type dipeptide/oligopeptide/nickel transport system permease component
MATALVIGGFVLLINLATDLLYAVIDPRIGLQ